LAADWRAHFAAAYRNQLQAWITALRTGVPVGASAWDGYVSTATAAACLDALGQEGRRSSSFNLGLGSTIDAVTKVRSNELALHRRADAGRAEAWKVELAWLVVSPGVF
jgi:hypothetical protein